MGVDVQRFKQVVGSFGSGVTIITTGGDGSLQGMTASAFCSLSIEPMLVLICANRDSRTCALIRSSGVFTVNILGEDQQELARLFASRELRETLGLAGVGFDLGRHGAPVLKGCLATIQCTVASQFDGGDHEIFVGEVIEADLGKDGPPLLYYRGAYRQIAG